MRTLSLSKILAGSSVLARGAEGTFSALRYPNYRRWFAGQSVSLMGTWMQSVALGWLVYELTGSEMALGAISFAGSLPSLFLMLPAGVIADRLPKQRLLLVTQGIMMLLAFTLAILTATKVLQVWQVAAIAVLTGAVTAFDVPSRLALAVELVDDRRDLQNAIALNATMFNMARIVGPAIGGIMLAVLGAAWCFGVNGLSFLAVLVALAGMHLPGRIRASHPEPMASQLRLGLSYAWHTPPVRIVIALMAVSSVFSMSYAVLLPAFAADVLRVGAAGLGAMNTAVGVGALVGALAAATVSRHPRKGMQITVGSLVFPLALLGFAFAATEGTSAAASAGSGGVFAVALVFLVMAGFGVVTQNAISNTLVQSIVPDHLRGRVTSIYSLMFFGPAPFGALLAGAVAQAFTPSAAVALGAGISLVFALGVILLAPWFRRTTVEPA